MEEIKVGEYVRTNRGMISKVIEIRPAKHKEKDIIENAYILEKGNWTIKQLIVSHNIDLSNLIEEGDYVNGDRMDIVEKDENGHTYYLQNCELPSVNLKDVKSIVTHEQFAQIEYKVEE